MIRRFVFLAVLAAAPACAAVQWQPHELTFRAEASYQNPSAEVDLRCEFSGPGKQRFAVPAFHDRGNVWKVRFAPTAPGKWTYKTAANVKDAGLAGRAGAFSVERAGGDNPLHRHGGFLKVSGGARYLTYSDGTPFFWLGDTWWFCPSELVPYDAFRKLIDKRREQRFTIAHMAFLGPPGAIREQVKSRTIQPDYWDGVDRYIAYANGAGIIPVIGLDFHKGMDTDPLENWKFVWRYFIARYAAHAVTFLICGEYNLEQGDLQGRVEKALALGRYIKELDPYKRAMTVHPWYFGREKRQAWDEPWYDFIMLQGGHGGHGRVAPAATYLNAWRRDPPKPVLEGETNYENIHAGKPEREVRDVDVRRSAYNAIQAGSFGFTYGAHGLWYPNQDDQDTKFEADWGEAQPWYQAYLKSGAAQMTHLRAAYEMVSWWKLEPRSEAARCDGVNPAAGPWVKAGGSEAVVYFAVEVPREAACTVRLGGDTDYNATWVNPRTGARTAAPGKLRAQGGAIALPARPGGEDWVLILRKD